MEYFWRCACGDQAVHTPDGEGLRTIRRHKMRMASAGEKGHYVLGLFDGDGNCIISGDRPDRAVELGLMEEVPKPVRPYKPKKKAGGGAAAGDTGGGVVKSPSNLQGVLTGMRIALPPSTWGWLALGFRYLRKEDGTEFNWIPEDVGLYISKVIDFWHMEKLHKIVGLSRDDPRVKMVVEAVMGMNGGPSVPVVLEGGGRGV